MKLVIQIPCFNEESTIAETLNDIPAVISGIDERCILIIDDGSTDRTVEVALANGADFAIVHPSNRGLASAFNTGIQTALALGANIILNTDADNQYPGKFIPNLVQPIISKQADVVVGDRQVLQNEHFSYLKRLLEFFGSFVIRVLTQTKVPDAPSGFRAFSRYVALRLHIYNKYSYTLENLMQLGNEGYRVVDMPIKTNAATRASRLHKGMMHFIAKQSGTILRSVLLYQPMRVFTAIGAPFILVSFLLGIRFLFFYLTHQAGIARYVNSVTLSGVLLIVGIILLMLGLIAEVVKTNRKSIEELLVRQRDSQKIGPTDTSFLGMRFVRKNKTSQQ